MKFKVLIMMAGLLIALGACSQKGIENIKLENEDDSLSYALGVDVYNNIKQNSDLEIDPMLMAKGMAEARDGKSIFNDMAASGYIMMVMQKRQEEKTKLEYKDYIDENEAFLEKNKDLEGVITTESGLQYKVLTMGTGPKPKPTDKVRVHYTGKLIDGTVFDSSVEKGEPAEFKANGLISGWSEGLQLMPVGSKFEFYIPYDLGYGARGAGQFIKPYSTLVFEVELLDIIEE